MSRTGVKPPAEKGNLLPRSPVSEAVELRAEKVGHLVAKRRKLALAYKRTRGETYRLELERIDADLAIYRIDIPAVQKSALGGKGAAMRVGKLSADGVRRREDTLA